MKRSILIFAQEAGSACVLLPIIEKLRAEYDYPLSIYALAPALYVFQRRLNDVKEWTGSLEKGHSLLLTGCGHPRHPANRLIFKEAKRRGLKSIALLDSWKGFERFFDSSGRISEDMPDIITVIDDASKASLVAMGLPAGTIEVTGHPWLEYISDKEIRDEDKRAARKKLKLPVSCKVAFFASELLHTHSYYEHCCLVRNEYVGVSKKDGEGKSGSTLKACRSLLNVQIHGVPLIRYIMETPEWKNFIFAARPHPNEKLARAEEIIVMDWEDADDIDVLNAADAVFGLSSFFIPLSVSAGVPTFNVEPFLYDWKPEDSYVGPGLWKYLTGKGYMGNWRDVKAAIPDNGGAVEKVIKIMEKHIA